METAKLNEQHSMEEVVELGRKAMLVEAEEIKKISGTLNGPFYGAVTSILESKGKLVVIGMGKSGLIGNKLVASFASTGTAALSMHPGEAYHGDLGQADENDVILMLSNSGETEEVLRLLAHFKNQGNTIISITGNESSTIAKNSNHHILCKVEQEACPLQLAPTASTTAAMAVGDALVVAVMSLRGFKPEDFARFHPGGSLGRKLLTKVKDEMVCVNLPWSSKNACVKELVHTISDSKLGCALVRDEADGLYGIVTDGDMRRAMDNTATDSFFDLTAELVASTDPVTVQDTASISEAEELMSKHKITALIVMNSDMKVVGVFTGNQR